MLYYAHQYFTTTLNVGGGIDDTQTTGIVAQSITGVDYTKPGIACISYSDPIVTPTAEWITYTSINNSTKEFQGVTRGAEGFSAKTHANGATIVFPLSESHINNLNDMFTTGGGGYTQIATPANPSSGYNKLYFKSDDKLYKLDSAGTETEIGAGGAAGTAFWSDVPGTPTRVSDTQFTITDTSNTNKYDLLFKKGTIIKWDESGTFQTGMVISSSYGTNTVTINIVGDSLTAGFTAMKYAIPKALFETFIIVGTFPSAATTDLSKTWYPSSGVFILSADLVVKTAGSGTGSTVVDINVSASTKFTTKPTLTTTGTSDIDNVADNPSTEVAAEAPVTVDVDSVTATTAPVDGYVRLYYYPSDWRYRS